MAKLSCGIVGLPNVGKSTLFNALTANQAAEASNYPFCTIDPNVGIVEVPDARLEPLSKLSGSQRILPAVMEFLDIAGLVAGASKGEGLGNKFLANIRETDAIVHVVRCFEDADVVHVAGQVNPIEDIEVINLELILADLQMLENSLVKVEKQARAQKEMKARLDVLKKVREHLNQNQPVRTMELTNEEKAELVFYPFLTAKKVLYVANVGEGDLPDFDNAYVRQVKEYAEKEGSEVVPICAQIEQEIAQLPLEERAEFLGDLGLEEPGLHRLIKASYRLLGLITYLTTGEKETRAWTVILGSTAPQAAGVIHSDFEAKFIRADVVPFKDMLEHQGWVGAREAGVVRTVGRDYLVEDGDVMLFKHGA